MFSFCITGHRPARLFKRAKINYDIHSDVYNSIREKIIAAVMQIIAATSETEIHAYTGMALGVDQIFAEICFNLKKELTAKGIILKVIAAIPCKGQDQKWPEESRTLYKKLLSQCDDSIVLVEKYTPACMQERNIYMVDHSDAVIAVYDGGHGGTGNCVKYAQKSGKEVIIVNPEIKAQEIKEENIMINVATNSAINNNAAIYVAVNQSTNYSASAIEALIGAVNSEIELAKKGGAKNVYLMTPLKNKAEKEVVKSLQGNQGVYPIGILWKEAKTTPEMESLIAWAHYEPKNENAWGVNHSSVVVAMGRGGNGFYAAKFAKENGVRCAQVTFEGKEVKVLVTEGKTIGILQRKDIEKVSSHKVAAPKAVVTAPRKVEVPKKEAVATKKTNRKEVKSMSDTKGIMSFSLEQGKSSDYYAQVIKAANNLLAEARKLKKEAKAVEKTAKEAAKVSKKSASSKAKTQPKKKAETKKEVKKTPVPVQTSLDVVPEIKKEVIIPEVKQETEKKIERPVKEVKEVIIKDTTPTGEALPIPAESVSKSEEAVSITSDTTADITSFEDYPNAPTPEELEKEANLCVNELIELDFSYGRHLA